MKNLPCLIHVSVCCQPAHIFNILALQGIFYKQLIELLYLVTSRKSPAMF